MNTVGCKVAVAFFTIFILGCTTIPEGAEESVAAGAVRIYGPAQLLEGKYETIKPLWVGSWRSAFWVPTYRTAEEGITALQTEAGRLGATGPTGADWYGSKSAVERVSASVEQARNQKT